MRTETPIGALTAAALLITLLLGAPASPAWGQEEADPKLAVVIRHTGQADAQLARDLQEVMVAALSDREGYLLVGKEDLQAQAGFASENEMISCLVDTACEEELRSRQNIKILLLGTIDQSQTHYEFSVQLIRDSGGEYSKIFRVPQSEGLDGLLSTLFEIAAELPIDEGPIPVVVKDPKKDPPPPDKLPKEDTPPPRETPPIEEPAVLGALGYTGIGALGVSVGSLVVGVIFNLQHQDTIQSQQDAIDGAPTIAGGAGGVTRADAQQREQDANDSARAANIFYGISIGTAVVGAALLALDLVDGSGETNPPAAGDVRLSPWVSGDSAGSALEISW
ncbi:MAG: hypothetical protein AAFX99_15585 [Myxococcota bacterium]